MKKNILFLISFVFFISSAKGQGRDSSMVISAGINYNWDYYGFYSWDNYRVENRFCSSAHFRPEIIKYFGGRKRVGIGIEPHIGVAQIAFHAVIPTTDFDHPADSVGNGFYRDGVKLSAETYTYRINYTAWGSNFHFAFRPVKKLSVSMYAGFLQYMYLSKNFTDFNLKYVDYQLSGAYERSINFVHYERNFWRVCAGAEIGINLSKRLQARLNGQIMAHQRYDFNDQPYIGFMKDSSGDTRGSGYMNRGYSIGLGVFYVFNQ